MGRLRVKIREDAAVAETVVGPAKVSLAGGPVLESGGVGLRDEAAGKFSPAREFAPGKVFILRDGLPFRRGDSNVDGQVDLSDAVSTLSHLFAGGAEPGCLDAADADDSGVVDITDPIFLLGVLFLGQGALPAPGLACGPDVTADGVDCTTTACGKG